MELAIYWPVLSTVPSNQLAIPSMQLDIYWPVLPTVRNMELDRYCQFCPLFQHGARYILAGMVHCFQYDARYI